MYPNYFSPVLENNTVTVLGKFKVSKTVAGAKYFFGFTDKISPIVETHDSKRMIIVHTDMRRTFVCFILLS